MLRAPLYPLIQLLNQLLELILVRLGVDKSKRLIGQDFHDPPFQLMQILTGLRWTFPIRKTSNDVGSGFRFHRDHLVVCFPLIAH